MKQDNWTQQLHDKLADYETPAPEGLWDDIEAALPRRRQARFVPLRRWAAAAAAVAALVCGSGGFLWWSHESQQKESMVSMAEASMSEDGMKESDVAETGMSEDSMKESGVADDATIDYVKKLRAAAPLSSLGEDRERPGGVGGGGSNSSTTIAQATPPEEQSKTPPLTPPLEGRGGAALEDSLAILPSQAPHKPHSPHKPHKTHDPHKTNAASPSPLSHPSLGLYALNSLGAKEGSNGVFMADALAKSYASTFDEANMPASRRQGPIFLSGYEERQHHYQPVAFGLTLNYPLSARLSLTSGVVYTRLRSDFTQVIGSQQMTQQQTLHYVGLPLGLSYRLFRLGAFSAYAAAGIQADWNVAARQNAEGVERSMDRDKMQWSAAASLGLQYSIPVGATDIALYAEPGIAHYFDNGSSVQNFFKDKPTSLKLQFGIRIKPPFRPPRGTR